MKKNFFMLAATAALFAACAETDLVNEVNVESNSQEIGFSTYAGKVTRAENSTVTETLGLEDHHGTFAVWAYKNTMKPYVFNYVKVTKEGNAWTYSPAKYWDKAANTYEFYAASPYRADWVLNVSTDAQNDDYFTLASFTLDDKTIADTEYVESFNGVTNQDLMIASPEKIEKDAIVAHQDVQLDFNHILSRLNVTVARGSNIAANDVVKLKSISIKNLPNSGSFTEKAIDVASSTERWELTGVEGNITGKALEEVKDEPSYVIQSLVIPQNANYEKVDRDLLNNTTFTAPYLYIEYSIGSEPFSATYNLANAFGKTDAGQYVSFYEGWQNTLNITLDAYAIVFDAVTFKWAVDAVKNPVID